MLSDSWTDCVAHLVSCTQYPFRFGTVMSAMVEARVQALLQAPSSPPRRVPMLPTSGGAQLNVDWEPQKKRFALSLQSKRSHRAQLSATELHAAHRDLRKAQPSLDELFPAKLAPRTCSEAQPVCAELKRYLKAVLEGCGATLVAWVFFSAEDVPYAELDPAVDDLQRRILEDELRRGREEMARVLEAKETLGLDTAYTMEDEVVTNISLALGELFNFRMSTFAEMHDLATGGRSTQWRERADSAQQSVDELTIVYHAACLELLGGQRDRMKRDLRALEFSRWSESQQNRFLKLSAFVSQERLRWMIAVRTNKRREYDRLAAGSSPKKQDRSLIEAKKEIYEHLLKILQEEENLLKKQKAIMEKIATGNADPEDFGDATEDVEELELIYGKRNLLNMSEVAVRLSSIYQRRAILRNKVQTCQNILNKGGFRDSSVSFTGRLSGDSSGCMSLATPSEEALEAARRNTLAALREYHRGGHGSVSATPMLRLDTTSRGLTHMHNNNNNNNNNISDTCINQVKAASLS
ncbi:WASP homolog-associated protein with actin, membranes and microtubules-like isoform X2 [Varroa destructor]|uniref:JMY/WHAMM middle domain-containing protein n=1 Tax=Varroa destructor TaxID=109461 RepID=A0A7M7KWR2_VARDE|nr:WASP homolog-associated protein with actin, membranes and microtubules-like isoform X2 [Varroa destructor]